MGPNSPITWHRGTHGTDGERCVEVAPGFPSWRGLATRYEKTATVHRAGRHIAGLLDPPRPLTRAGPSDGRQFHGAR
ncbi:hypothetical protein [Kitasatospora sp. NPDC059827]|uniref:hypothetical protein n=1 Tax=Kitasatospora sp. NPDC059827 TaxID=3346964 RepID=UPI003661E3BF